MGAAAASVVSLDLREVTYNEETRTALFQICVCMSDGSERLLEKQLPQLRLLLDVLRSELTPETQPPPVPLWELDHASLSKDEAFHGLLRAQLRVLSTASSNLSVYAARDFCDLTHANCCASLTSGITTSPASVTGGLEAVSSGNHNCDRSDVKVPTLGGRVERIVDEFYDDQLRKHASDRARLEQKLGGSRGSCGLQSSATWRRQDAYLDPVQRERFRAASLRHLQRRCKQSGELSSCFPCGDNPSNLAAAYAAWAPTHLRRLVAVQHFVDLDLADLDLPEGERRGGDRFQGEDFDVCEQMLLDAHRATFLVDGKRFGIAEAKELSAVAQGDTVQDPRRSQQRALAAAVRQSLAASTGGPPPQLMRAVTTAMSQSGMASLELAFDGPQVAVCGGDQEVFYELRSRPDCGAWDVKLRMRKFAFEHLLVVVDDEVSQDTGGVQSSIAAGGPLSCDPRSYVEKSCVIRFSLEPSMPVGSSSQSVGIRADVQEVHMHAHLIDGWRRPIQLPGGERSRARGGSMRHKVLVFADFLVVIIAAACGQDKQGCQKDLGNREHR